TRADRSKKLFRHYTVGSYDSFDTTRTLWSELLICAAHALGPPCMQLLGPSGLPPPAC
ncbi:hypothetical protein P7K49_021280, partial [Saguinus oedipus]